METPERRWRIQDSTLPSWEKGSRQALLVHGSLFLQGTHLDVFFPYDDLSSDESKTDEYYNVIVFIIL